MRMLVCSVVVKKGERGCVSSEGGGDGEHGCPCHSDCKWKGDTSHIKAVKLENAPVDFGGLPHVERAVNRCISAYTDYPERCRTHQDRFSPCSWYLQHKSC